MAGTWTLEDDPGSSLPRLVVTGAWSNEARAVFEAESLERLILVGVSDVSAVAELSTLRHLGVFESSADLGPMSGAGRLESVKVYGCQLKRPVDFRALRRLRSLEVDDGCLDPVHLPAMTVEYLRVMNWKHEDLTPIAKCPTLQDVQLDGVRRLRRLASPGPPAPSVRSLNLAYGRGVIEASGVERFSGVEQLTLERLRLDPLAAIVSLGRLRRFGLIGAGEIKRSGVVAWPSDAGTHRASGRQRSER